MADPKKVTLVGVKVAGANVGEIVRIVNLTRGSKLSGKLTGTDRSIVFNKAPAEEWQDGDLIQAEIDGSVSGSAQETINQAKAIIKLVASADTSVPGVSL